MPIQRSSSSSKHIIQSAGGVVYYLDNDKEPKYLLIKRQAISKKIERVCPKGKVQEGETIEEAALREVSEEVGLPINALEIQGLLGVTHIRTDENMLGNLNKDMTYFLMHYSGDPTKVKIIDGEGYVGVYKWYTLQEVLGLIFYADMRELIRKSYIMIKDMQKHSTIKENFIASL